MPDQPLLDEISLFFNDYIVAFDANDGAAIVLVALGFVTVPTARPTAFCRKMS